MEMDWSKLSSKTVLAVVMILGTLILLTLLFFGSVPTANRDFFNMTLGAWLAWTAMAVKRIFDGSDSSDQKNETISNLASATNTAMTLPPAEPKP